VQIPGNPSEHHTLIRIGWSHRRGEFWGLAPHPMRDEFATCGSDKALRVWSIRSKEMINARPLPVPGRALAYSPKGEILAVGLVDGSVGLMDAASAALKVGVLCGCVRPLSSPLSSP
jgi:WD40 repeat protein